MRVIVLTEAEFALTQEPLYRKTCEEIDDFWSEDSLVMQSVGRFTPAEAEEYRVWIAGQRHHFDEQSSKAISLWRAHAPGSAEDWRIVHYRIPLDHPDEEEVTVILTERLGAFIRDLTTRGGAGPDDLGLFRNTRSGLLGNSIFVRSGPATVWARLQGCSVDPIP